MLDARLWTPRSVEETRSLYAGWAKDYDADVTGAGYRTPARLAAALARASDDLTAPILDFGCGTGLAGQALAAQGFTTIDGTDITAEMIDVARALGLYRDLRVTEPGAPPAPGYTAIAGHRRRQPGAAPPRTAAIAASKLSRPRLLASLQRSTFADDCVHGGVGAAVWRADAALRGHAPTSRQGRWGRPSMSCASDRFACPHPFTPSPTGPLHLGHAYSRDPRPMTWRGANGRRIPPAERYGPKPRPPRMGGVFSRSRLGSA